MITVAHGHSRLWRGCQCVAGLFGKNRVSDGRRSGPMERGCGGMEGEWTTETLFLLTKGNNGNCYFTPVSGECGIVWVEPAYLHDAEKLITISTLQESKAEKLKAALQQIKQHLMQCKQLQASTKLGLHNSSDI
ncbi:hypothetical protein EVAR_75748_1 [Eumeta japonica]|uniref:Uncharacterized protein n=1 Tax=Eumeta variegata TaxID=151549 RepID=A0A4C1TCP9_EUMVA|nr:hypothetical protein EVAR_75748_1 [Eumeta japonica]